MLDIIIQAYGSLQAGAQFCIDNNVSITDTPVVGTEYILTDEAFAGGDVAVLTYLRSNRLVVGTLGDASIEDQLLNEDGSPLLNEDGSPLLNEGN